MAQLLNTSNRRRQVADTYYQLKHIKSKVQRKAADIGFVMKALRREVTPTFAKVRGNFNTNKDKWKAERMILESNLRQHHKDMKRLIKKMSDEEKVIQETHTPRFCRFVENRINKALRNERLNSFKTKNKKLDKLIKQKIIKKDDAYRVPIINLSNVTLSEEEKKH